MEKELRLNRRELVWEYYIAAWGKRDWEDLVRYYKKRAEEAKEYPNNTWRQNDEVIYKNISKYSWEEVCEDFQKYRDGDREHCISWEEDHSYTDCDGERHESIYKNYLAELVEECMRDDCYSNGCSDTEYADDSDEDWSLYEENKGVTRI